VFELKECLLLVERAESVINPILRVEEVHVDSACWLQQKNCNETNFRNELHANESTYQRGLVAIIQLLHPALYFPLYL
jgi:hypothetical protein